MIKNAAKFKIFIAACLKQHYYNQNKDNKITFESPVLSYIASNVEVALNQLKMFSHKKVFWYYYIVVVDFLKPNLGK